MNLKDVTRIDIGCGSPDQKYHDCFGLDVNPVYEPDLLHNCDNGLPFENESLNFINSDNSLEHVKNPYFVLKECYRCLKKGGRMRLVVPGNQYLPLLLMSFVVDINRFWLWYMNLKHKKDRSPHWTLFTKDLARMMVEDVGFKITSVKGCYLSWQITFFLEK